MANTVYGPYVSTNWVAGTTPLSQPNMLNLEKQAAAGTHSMNPDEGFDGFFHSGCQASGTVGTTTVNIAAGRAYLIMTDGTVSLIVVGSATQTTVTINTTYNLYLQPDGTFYWSTSNSPQANSLYIATVATDGSGNIATITDKRPKLLRWLGGQSGLAVQLPPQTIQLGNVLAAPPAGMAASAVSGAGMGTGAYKYVVTFAADGLETLPSAAVNVTTAGGNTQVSLTAIPVSADPRVKWRKLYRTAVGGSTYTWVATLGDNTTTTYTDAASDASIANGKTYPSHSTFGGTLKAGYPWSSGLPNPTNQGSVNNAPTFGVAGLVTGDSTTCVTFAAASSQYITGPGNLLPVYNSPFTISGVFKFASNPGAATVMMALGGTTSLTGVKVWIDTAGKLNADCYGSSAIVSAAAVSTSVSHTASLKYDGVTLTLLLDGASVGTPTTPLITLPSSPTFTIGANGTPASYWSGQLQYVAVYNSTLSTAQLLKQFNLVAGASGSLTYALEVADDAPLRLYTLGDAVGSTIAAESSRYETQITSDGQYKSGMPVNLDRGLIQTNGNSVSLDNDVTAGKIYTDGHGRLTITKHMAYDQVFINLLSQNNNAFFYELYIDYITGNFGLFDGKLTRNILFGTGSAMSSDATWAIAGIVTINGQNTVGSFGVPVIVAQTINQVVAVTTQQTILTFTPPANGLYRANIFVALKGSANSATANLGYHDPQLVSVVTLPFNGTSGGGAIQIGAAGFPASWAAFPLVFYADTTAAITIKYQNSAGVPNDAVSAFLERLS